MGGDVSAYGFAYICLAISAVILTFLATGLKGRSAELEMMK